MGQTDHWNPWLSNPAKLQNQTVNSSLKYCNVRPLITCTYYMVCIKFDDFKRLGMCISVIPFTWGTKPRPKSNYFDHDTHVTQTYSSSDNGAVKSIVCSIIEQGHLQGPKRTWNYKYFIFFCTISQHSKLQKTPAFGGFIAYHWWGFRGMTGRRRDLDGSGCWRT